MRCALYRCATTSAPSSISNLWVSLLLKVMLCLHPDLLSIDHFAERILRLPPRLVTPLVQNPIPWPAAKNHERFVYSAMARYLGLPTDRLVVEIDTKEVAKDVLRFLREHGISTTDFATKVVRLQRATLTNYLVSCLFNSVGS